MRPTNYLRFVERPVPITEDTARLVKILQQWWEDNTYDIYIPNSPSGSAGEWRDVPLEKN